MTGVIGQPFSMRQSTTLPVPFSLPLIAPAGRLVRKVVTSIMGSIMLAM